MNQFRFYIGIDIAKDDFAASILSSPDAPIHSLTEIPNEPQGFDQLEAWLVKNQVLSSNCVICLEATGVYGEDFSHWFTAKGYKVAVEPPLKVKRSFSDKSHKNDKADSRKIAQYAYRFADELRIWSPKDEVVEHIKVLLTVREQLVQQKTALTNALKALMKKVVQTPLAIKIYTDNIDRLKTQIKRVEDEIKNQIDQHPDYHKIVQCLMTAPGVGLLLSANFLVITDGFKNDLAFKYRKAAAFIGVCPYEFKSGSSVYRRPRTPKYGPSIIRKLLHLGARSLVVHKKNFILYYQYMQKEGKKKRLILNNVANKLLKIMCAIVRDKIPFSENHISLHPSFFTY